MPAHNSDILINYYRYSLITNEFEHFNMPLNHLWLFSLLLIPIFSPFQGFFFFFSYFIRSFYVLDILFLYLLHITNHQSIFQ